MCNCAGCFHPADRVASRGGGVGLWVWHGHDAPPPVSHPRWPAVRDADQPRGRSVCSVSSVWAGQRAQSAVSLSALLWRVFSQQKCLTNHSLLSRTAVSTFKDFELASTQQRPDTVLRRRRIEQQQRTLEAQRGGTVAVVQPTARRFMRLAVMGLTVALGAAALAVVNSALEWAPKLDLLFPWRSQSTAQCLNLGTLFEDWIFVILPFFFLNIYTCEQVRLMNKILCL